jgi:hypothetical protein
LAAVGWLLSSSGGDSEDVEQFIYETDLVFDARLTGEAMPAPDHTHHFKALDRSGRCPHRLKAPAQKAADEISGRVFDNEDQGDNTSSGSDDALQGAMVGFNDVVQISAGSMFCVGRQLALALQAVNCFGRGTELIGGDRGRGPVAHGRQCLSQETMGCPSVAAAVGGLPGSRLLASLGIRASREMVLRRIKVRAAARSQPNARVIGVDDWAWRKRQRYGTILMDLEQNAVIDLLPDRSTASFTGWLERHPGVEIITRDRCGLYAAGARRAALNAVQVADRFHLLQNLSDAVDHDIQRLQIEARGLTSEPTASNCEQPRRLTLIEARRQRCRQARYERYRTVLDMTAKGHTQLAIAAQIGIDPETI